MKTISSFSSVFFALAVIITTASSCQHSTPTPTLPCGNYPVFASWKVDGVSYSATAFTGVFGTAMQFTGYGCVPSGQLAPKIYMQIPHAIQLGTFDLKKTASSVGATYTNSTGQNYYANSTNYVGSLTVTSMNMADSSYNATFQFTVADSSGNVVHITDGQIINNFF